MEEIFKRLEFRIIQLEHYSSILECIIKNLGKHNINNYFVNQVCWCLHEVGHTYPVIEIYTLIENRKDTENLYNIFLKIKENYDHKLYEDFYILIEKKFKNLHTVFTKKRCNYFAHKNTDEMIKKYVFTESGGIIIKRDEYIDFEQIKLAIKELQQIYECLYRISIDEPFSVWHGYNDSKIKSITFNIEII